MNKLTKFINKYKDKCYRIAENNTDKDKSGKPIIRKGDEWEKEKEWDNIKEDKK